MKKLVWILLLASCAKVSEETSIRELSAKPVTLTNTENRKEEELVVAAKTMLETGGSISASEALLCLSKEIHRKNVQLLCSLLWATRQEENSVLEKFIHERVKENREWAPVLLIQKIGLSRLESGELLAILTGIESQPLSLFVNGLEYWFHQRKAISQSEARALSNWLKTQFSQQPHELVSYLRILWMIDRTEFQRALQSFCRPNWLGKAKWFCWKSLRFSEQDLHMDRDLKNNLLQFYPRSWNESGWKEFRKLFPKTSTNTQKYLEVR